MQTGDKNQMLALVSQNLKAFTMPNLRCDYMPAEFEEHNVQHI